MGRLLWLPEVLQDAGVDLWISPGAETRGKATIEVNGVVWHHTVTGLNWSDAAVHALLRDGRRDLAGPLAQFGIERDGTWVLVAMGRANHNGYGYWGNNSIGLEFYNKGDGIDPWPDAQVESGVRGTAAILKHLGLDPADHVRGHKETDPRRKPDPVPLNMAAIRARVQERLDGTPPFPYPVEPTPEQEIDMGAGLDTVLRVQDMVGGLPHGGLFVYGDGGNLNDVRVMADGELVQRFFAGQHQRRSFGDGFVFGSVSHCNLSDTEAGNNTRVDFTVETKVGKIRWYTFDPIRPGFPDEPPAGAKAGPDGWHYVELD